VNPIENTCKIIKDSHDLYQGTQCHKGKVQEKDEWDGIFLAYTCPPTILYEEIGIAREVM